MTQLVRRLYSALAIALFLVVAPLVVTWTSGYRWSGWHTGFTQTGSLYITSQPRAMLWINGQPRGQTPQRLPHLTPGTYTLELKKDGFGVWDTQSRIVPSGAVTIGPVQLFPATFTVTYLDRPADEQWVGLADQAIYGLTGTTSVQAREIWPNPSDTIYTLPWMPTSVTANQNRQGIAFIRDTDAAIFTSTHPDQPWMVEGVGSLQWENGSQVLLYGQQGKHVTRFDTYTATPSVLGDADSYALLGDTVWTTRQEGTSTKIFKQQTFGQSTPVNAETLDGPWTLDPSSPTSLLLKNTDTQEYQEGRYDALTKQLQRTSFGPVDQLWWSNRTQPPIWQTNGDILTQDEHGVPLLIDRAPQPLNYAAWLVPYHILLTVDEHVVRIQSVSDRQGRGTLLERRFDETITAMNVDPAEHQLVLRTISEPHRLITLQW